MKEEKLHNYRYSNNENGRFRGLRGLNRQCDEEDCQDMVEQEHHLHTGCLVARTNALDVLTERVPAIPEVHEIIGKDLPHP